MTKPNLNRRKLTINTSVSGERPQKKKLDISFKNFKLKSNLSTRLKRTTRYSTILIPYRFHWEPQRTVKGT